MNISTKLVSEALTYYENLGYKPLDVPLVVDQDVSEHTKPEGVPDLNHTNNRVYIASGEQSFVQLHKDGNLPNGKYMAITPCYRQERFLDETHYLMFLKIELIVVGLYKRNPLFKMISDCKHYFEEYLQENVRMEGNIIFGEVDLTCKGVELGSYGSREMIDGTKYYYGTALASPRVEYVKNLIIKEENK